MRYTRGKERHKRRVSDEESEAQEIRTILADYPIDWLGNDDGANPFVAWLDNLEEDGNQVLVEVINSLKHELAAKEPTRKSTRTRKETVAVFDPDSPEWESNQCTWPDDWPQYYEDHKTEPKRKLVRNPKGKWISAEINQNVDLKMELLPGGIMPRKGTEDSIGLDLYSAMGDVIPAQDQLEVKTGVRIQVPFGTYGRIAPRSGLARKGIDVMAGVIDHDYQGEVIVILRNHSQVPYDLKKGDRIAQLICEVAEDPQISLMGTGYFDSRNATQRGSKGFGSTGR